MVHTGYDEWAVQECKAQGFGEPVQVKAVNDIFCRSTVEPEDSSIAISHIKREAKFVQRVYMVWVQDLGLCDKIGR